MSSDDDGIDWKGAIGAALLAAVLGGGIYLLSE
jgi:hypothetical protein